MTPPSGPFAPHHLAVDAAAVAGNGGRGRFFFIPGSDGRARRIAEHFEDHRVHPSPRQLNVHTGVLLAGDRRLEVGVVATGMGSPAVDVVANELLLLGVTRLLRVGTAGSLQPKRVRVGDLVIATAAVRDDHASNAYAPREFPAVAHPHWVAALSSAARGLGSPERCFVGAIHAKDSLYGTELGIGPLADRNAAYLRALQALGVLATEMESGVLFTLGAVHGPDLGSLADPPGRADVVKCGTVLAIVGDDEAFASEAAMAAGEERAIDLALAGALALARHEAGQEPAGEATHA